MGDLIPFEDRRKLKKLMRMVRMMKTESAHAKLTHDRLMILHEAIDTALSHLRGTHDMLRATHINERETIVQWEPIESMLRRRNQAAIKALAEALERIYE